MKPIAVESTLPDPPIINDAPAIRFQSVTKLFSRGDRQSVTLKESVLLSLSRRERSDLVTALEEIDLSIGRGEAFGLIGPNGSGKSTLLKLIAGISEPTSGRIEMRGRVLGLIELGAGFHPELTGEENIRLQGSIYGLSAAQIDERMDSILAFAELDDFRHLQVKHYSSGMFVRLGFAIAMHTEPDVLLVDEILAVGDQRFQNRCLKEIARRREAGMTVVLVTHDVAQVEALCGRAAWLERGRIRKLGPVAEVITAYHDDLLASRYAEPEGPLDVRVLKAGLPGRFGSGAARIERVRLIGRDGQVTTCVRRDETLRLEFEFSTQPGIDAVDCAIPLVALDATLLDYWRAGRTFGPIKPTEVSPDGRGRGHFTAEIESLPALPGRYELSIALSDPADPDTHYDVLYRLFYLTVRGEEGWEPAGSIGLKPQVRLLDSATDAPDDSSGA